MVYMTGEEIAKLITDNPHLPVYIFSYHDDFWDECCYTCQKCYRGCVDKIATCNILDNEKVYCYSDYEDIIEEIIDALSYENNDDIIEDIEAYAQNIVDNLDWEDCILFWSE